VQNRREQYRTSKRIRPQILTAVSYLASKVLSPTIEDQAYVVIDSVIESIDPKDIILSGSAEPIDFTDQKSPALRTMQEIADESKCYFANVISALKFQDTRNTKQRSSNRLPMIPPKRLILIWTFH
jgi:hypothetical protein